MPQDLPDAVRPEEDAVCIGEPVEALSSFEDQIREYKIKLANRAILECNGNKTLAAKSLRISRAYLHRLLRGGADDSVRVVSDEFNVA